MVKDQTKEPKASVLRKGPAGGKRQKSVRVRVRVRFRDRFSCLFVFCHCTWNEERRRRDKTRLEANKRWSVRGVERGPKIRPKEPRPKT